MDDIRNVITGVPDRSSNSNGGDTGQAVLNRDGWTDIEIVARFKEIFFKKGKKKQLAVGLRILQILGLISEDLKVKDNTLIKISNKTNTLYLEGKDNIINQFK